jgi:hypothetical protein
MKHLRVCTAVWLMLSILLYPSSSSGNSNNINNGKTAVNAQYIRTSYINKAKYQPITVISSKKDLIRLPDNDFLNKIDKYSDDYFADSSLVIVRLTERSGSIGHSVESIGENGDIVINRIFPLIETCDMAAWCILIKINNKIKAKQYRIIFINVSEIIKLKREGGKTVIDTVKTVIDTVRTIDVMVDW